MKKFITILVAFIEVTIFGFILPQIILPQNKLGSELNSNFRRAMHPIGALLLAAIIFQDKNNQYQNRCRGTYEQVLMQSYSWMFIPGPVIEACVVRNEQGEITDMKSIGMIKKGEIYPNF